MIVVGLIFITVLLAILWALCLKQKEHRKKGILCACLCTVAFLIMAYRFSSLAGISAEGYMRICSSAEELA